MRQAGASRSSPESEGLGELIRVSKGDLKPERRPGRSLGNSWGQGRRAPEGGGRRVQSRTTQDKALGVTAEGELQGQM